MYLKILRILAKMTQAEAAAAVGVTQAALSDWEKGKYKPSPAAVAKLAAVSNVSEAEIVKAVQDAANNAEKHREENYESM